MIQTDASRAIVLRFSSGSLVRVNARGNSVEDAIRVLHTSADYKFSFSSIRVDRGAELMGVAEFIELLGQGSETSADTTEITDITAADGQPAAADIAGYNRDMLQKMLIQMSVEHIGPIASIVVEQAIDDGSSIEEIVNLIADQIPDHEAASQFTELAIEGAREAR